jgi:hypothetical protein
MGGCQLRGTFLLDVGFAESAGCDRLKEIFLQVFESLFCFIIFVLLLHFFCCINFSELALLFELPASVFFDLSFLALFGFVGGLFPVKRIHAILKALSLM